MVNPIFKLISDLVKEGLFKFNIDLRNQSHNTYNLVLQDSQKVLELVNNDTFILDPSKIPKEKLPLLKSKLGELIHKDLEKGSQIIDQDSYVLEKEIEDTIKEGSKIVDFFADKIPSMHLEILKVAVLIKRRFEKGIPIDHIKSDLYLRYGKVANTICNLFTSGYFEHFLIPLYAELSKKEGFRKEDFSDYFEILMNDFPLAEFINQWDEASEVEARLVKRIISNKQFGHSTFKIHGIGKVNIFRIEETIAKLEKDKKILVTNINKTKKTIVVEVTIL